MMGTRVATLGLMLLLAACRTNTTPLPSSLPAKPPTPASADAVPPPVRIRIGVALGGGAAKGFAHIGVLKMLEANGLTPDIVAGTSAGSLVGALYASGMDIFRLQQTAVALDETSIRDVRLFSGGLIKGAKLQDYVNETIDRRTFEKLSKPFAVVSTRLDNGARTVFVRGDVGQAVRASCSIPGLFEPTRIGNRTYVDGGLVSPVPVDAARQLGADFVIAVDISSHASGKAPENLLGVVNQSITIMGQKLGEQERARADVLIRPNVNDIGAADFEQRNNAIIEGERAALKALPQIRAKLAQLKETRTRAEALRIAAAQAEHVARQRAAQPSEPPCAKPGWLASVLTPKNKCAADAAR